LLFEKNIHLRPFITNSFYNRSVKTNDFEELNIRIYNLIYGAIMGMQGGSTSWGTFTYNTNNQKIILLTLVQKSKNFGQVLIICLPEEV
jgi:hypothetical protein